MCLPSSMSRTTHLLTFINLPSPSPLSNPSSTSFHTRSLSHPTFYRYPQKNYKWIISCDANRSRPFGSKILSKGVELLLRSLCQEVQDLKVIIDANSNLELLSGRVQAVSITFSKVLFQGLHLTQGRLYTDEIMLTASSGVPNLARPFCLSGSTFVTQADLNESPPIKEGFKQLFTELVRTLVSGILGKMLPKKIGGLTPQLEAVQLLGNGRLVMKGLLLFTDGTKYFIEVESGLRIQKNGSLITLSDPTISFNVPIFGKINLPLVTVLFGVQLDDDITITELLIEDDRIFTEGFVIIRPATPPRSTLTDSSTKGRLPPGTHRP